MLSTGSVALSARVEQRSAERLQNFRDGGEPNAVTLASAEAPVRCVRCGFIGGGEWRVARLLRAIQKAGARSFADASVTHADGPAHELARQGGVPSFVCGHASEHGANNGSAGAVMRSFRFCSCQRLVHTAVERRIACNAGELDTAEIERSERQRAWAYPRASVRGCYGEREPCVLHLIERGLVRGSDQIASCAQRQQL